MLYLANIKQQLNKRHSNIQKTNRLKMKTFAYNEKLDLRRRPYRGIITQIAAKQGVSRSAIVQSLQIANPRIVEEFVKHVNEAEALQNEAVNALKSLAV